MIGVETRSRSRALRPRTLLITAERRNPEQQGGAHETARGPLLNITAPKANTVSSVTVQMEG